MPEWTKTKSLGVRYRLHKTRKHGVGYDRYFVIRYKLAGKDKGEGVGWGSEGMTEKKAAAILAELRANQTNGTPPFTLAEKRQLEDSRREEVTRQAELQEKADISFAKIFTDSYLPHIQANRKNPRNAKRDEQIYRLHIQPVFKNLPLRKISQINLERLKKNMADAGQSPRSIRYALAVVRQVFNFAIRTNLYDGQNPAAGGRVERPKEDNKKDRYLTREEADLLLNELAKQSTDVHDMAMLSLYTGMRFSEVANLTWGNVDLFSGIAMLRKTKSSKDRPAYLTPAVKTMLIRRKKDGKDKKNDDLVFPARRTENTPRTLISATYYKTVKRLFNEGITDRKQWVNFHTLRHTFASWLVSADTNIWVVKDLLGHSDLKTTERYAHVGENQAKMAVLKLQG